MKKIIIFNSGSSIYGAEKGLINLIAALKHRYDVTIVLPNRGPLFTLLKEKGIKLKIFPLPILACCFSPFYYLKFILLFLINIIYFSSYIFYYRIDIIYTNTALLFFPLAISKITKRPHIWHIREFFSFGLVNSAIGRLGNNSCNGIVCMSENIKATVFSYYKKDNLKVIYEALDNFSYKRYDYFASRKELAIHDKSIVISMISRIHPQKGQYEFLKIAQNILRGEDILFLIVGDIAPPNFRNFLYRKKIENFIKKRGLRDRVHLLGFRDDVDKILSLTDICVFPFLREEPFGLAMAEAFIFGKRVLFYHRRGLDEIDAFFSHAGETLSRENLRQGIEKIRRSRFIENNITIPPVFSFNNYEKEINSFIESITKK